MLAIAPELTMADHEAQSDEMDIVSIDSDRAEPGAADAAGVVCPLRVKSVSKSKRMRRPLAALASDALRLGLRLLGGAAGEHAAQNVATETAPWNRREPVRAFITGLWIEDYDKKGIQTIYSLTRM
jgi:hypothetical protein